MLAFAPATLGVRRVGALRNQKSSLSRCRNPDAERTARLAGNRQELQRLRTLRAPGRRVAQARSDGVAPGTKAKTTPNAMATLAKNDHAQGTLSANA